MFSDSLTWSDVITLLQAVFTFLTAAVAFISVRSNRSIKAVDVSLGCQVRHANIMEKLYRMPYTTGHDHESHMGIKPSELVSETELFAQFNVYWHLIHDEYQYWRDGLITNEMFFRWIDGIFDEFRRNYIYYCQGLQGSENSVSFAILWHRVRDHWFHSRSFARFTNEVEGLAASGSEVLEAQPLMVYKKRRFRNVR